MYQLFKELRGDKLNTMGSIISKRCLVICEVLEGLDPLPITGIQTKLVAKGEKWATSKPGYLAVWTLCDQLRAAGVLVGDRKVGMSLASMDAAVDHFTVALTELIESTIPNFGDLGILRSELLNMVLGHAVKTRARIFLGRQNDEAIKAG